MSFALFLWPFAVFFSISESFQCFVLGYFVYNVLGQTNEYLAGILINFSALNLKFVIVNGYSFCFFMIKY